MSDTPYKPTLEDAIQLVLSAFRGKLDRSGKHMVLHSLRVMATAQLADLDEEVQIVAVFHDLIEDTAWTLDDLLWEGYSERVLAGVYLLTRREDQTYRQYIQAILDSGNKDAIHVKLLDAQDNIRRCRPEDPHNKELAGLYVRYVDTVRKMEDALDSLNEIKSAA